MHQETLPSPYAIHSVQYSQAIYPAGADYGQIQQAQQAQQPFLSVQASWPEIIVMMMRCGTWDALAGIDEPSGSTPQLRALLYAALMTESTAKCKHSITGCLLIS